MATNTPEKEEEKKTEFVDVCGLWAGRGKVLFTSRVKEELVIPAGSKLLAFGNDTATADNKRPQIRLVYVMED